MKPTHHRILNADSRDMSEMPDASARLAIAALPPAPIRAKRSRDPEEFSRNLERHIDSLNLVWSECARVLHPGCRLCVIAPDPFTRVNEYGSFRIVPIHSTVIRFCEAAGLDYMGAIISRHEHGAAAREHLKALGSFPHPRNGVIINDFDHILVFRKPGKGPAVTDEMKKSARFGAREWNKLFAGSWNLEANRKSNKRNNHAVEIRSRLMRMFSFPGETVLDPFVGDAAVSIAAMRLGRDTVGYEASPQLARAARNLLIGEKGLFDQETVVEFNVPERSDIDWDSRLEALPWRYREVVPLPPPPEPKKPRRVKVVESGDAKPKKRGRPKKQTDAVDISEVEPVD